MSLISYKKFHTIVERHKGDYKVRGFSCWHQFLYMAFGQITRRDSLRDTVLVLSATPSKLYHLGMGTPVALSTLSRANEGRPHIIFEQIAMQLIGEARELYSGEERVRVEALGGSVFALDATTIDLCLSTFYWATFRKTKGGIRLHTQLNLTTLIPEFILITTASVHEVHLMDRLHYERGCFYVVDRGYIDYKRLYTLHQSGAYFVTRAKENMSYRRVQSFPKDREGGVRFDQSILLNGYYAARDYPVKMRLIKYTDPTTGKHLVFLTNHFQLTALQVAQLYKERWQIELFFKWIKQHLKLKAFWGHSENAVKVQVWIAIATYTLIAIAKKKYCIEQSLHEILQIISILPLEKKPMKDLFEKTNLQKNATTAHNQLKMF